MSTILITVDALRADHLGQYGYERDTMPVLDRLCDSGVTFENAFANGPYTRISVPALHSSVRLGHADLQSLPTISSELGEAGVTTACIGTRTGFKSAEGNLNFDAYVTLGRDEYHKESKQQQSPHVKLKEWAVPTLRSATKPYPKLYDLAKNMYDSLPFSNFRYLGYTSAEGITDTTTNWLADHANEEFFLWLHYMEGHRPYGVHDEDPAYTTAISDDQIRTLMKKAGQTPDEMSIAEHRKIVDLYDSDLRYCSTHIERLFDNLQELNVWDDTDIVFTSDHGEEFYEHGEYFHRNLPYDELLHVPLIVRSPATNSQEDITEQRELIDVAPTILNFHDVEQPTGFEGQNLFSGDSRDVIATGCQQQKPPVVAGRWDGYKYISTPDGEYLFDLPTNAFEDNNISAENESLCQQYRGAIPRRYFSEELEEKLREPDDEVDRERLEALGYLEIDD